MSRRDRRQEPARTGLAGEAAHPVVTLIEKRRYKDAFKQAKLCFRQKESAENRRLVEQTYVLRIQELTRGGMHNAAADVARHCLDFGVTDSTFLAELVTILPSLGMSDRAIVLCGKLQAPDAQATLSLKLADRAVLDPGHAPAAMPELREGALRLRSALAAVGDGNEALAAELLKDIPRGSPWADWRYFARGLAAHYRGDREQARENWNRLDQERPASRIAAALDPSGSDVDLPVLETAVFGAPLLAKLARLGELLQAASTKKNGWKEAIQILGPLRMRLRQFDPRLAERLTEVLLCPLQQELERHTFDRAQRFLHEFTNAAEALSIDPNWNRFWAILWEGMDDGHVPTVGHWKKYVEDLDRVGTLNAHQRRQLQAIVWRHIAELFKRAAHDSPTWAGPERHSETESMRSRVVEALRESIGLDPTQLQTHEMLIELQTNWKNTQGAAAAARRCLEAFPDHIESLNLLIQYHRTLDEPAKSLEWIQRARTLKPLDEALVRQEAFSRLTLARHLALEGRWQEGRAEFERVRVIQPAKMAEYPYLARQAVFEFKAGQNKRAEDLLNQALSCAAEPTAPWLTISIEAVRYELPSSLQRRFETKWRKAVRKKPSSETAGLIAQTLIAYKLNGIEYFGIERHRSEVADYLRRTTRLAYRESDLWEACNFLNELDEKPLIEKLIRRGLKLFPESPRFHLLAGEREVDKGPFKFKMNLAMKHFERALELAQDGPQSNPGLCDVIKRQLLELKDLSTAMGGMPGFGAKRGRDLNFLDVLNALGLVDEDDEDDEEDEYEEDSEGEEDGDAGMFSGFPFGADAPEPEQPNRKAK